MYVCMYVCMYSMYVLDKQMFFLLMCDCIHVFMYDSIYKCMFVCLFYVCMYVCMYCMCAKLLLPKSSRIGTGITPLTIHFPSSLHHKIVRSTLSLLIHTYIHIHTYLCLLLLDGHLLRSEEETRCRHHSNAKVTRLIALLPQHKSK